MPSVNLLVHLVSVITPAITFGRSVLDLEFNLFSTLKLLEEAAHFKVSQVIFASSGGTVYGSANTIQSSWIKHNYLS